MEQEKKKQSRPRRKRRDTLRPIEFLYRQIYDISSNVVLGYEADVIVNDKKLGMLSYDKMNSVAQRSELTCRLGKWQITEACEALIRAEKYGRHIHRIFITLSAKHISKPNFVQDFQKILTKYEISGTMFCVQINEIETRSPSKQMQVNISALKELGVKIAMINFGAESSSLLKLSNANIDYLKLDPAFAEDILNDEKVADVTESIIEMCEKLGVSVIADGVDTKEHLDLMKKMRCFLVQGNYFSRYDREEEAIV